ncbi:alpha/beta hydrolase family protein [Sphingobacterium deserti]|uniref:Peptidase S9 prolyl oligopeptidase active site domain protein n=1 Tax=Sphingobacterium deserti TaxID=1229276 RepID=A0A0B8T2Q1_9SPHI|nr:S9 family peptidase [Sphingobacterium deserti]KGE15637.1 peptidase S9 prolyl oligopeptidase active site domain protein [Sphingobacterium deserti]
MYRFLLWGFAVGLLAFFIACRDKQSTDQLIPVEDFFVKPEKINFRISPDGKRIAYLGIDDHCRNIFVLDLDDKTKSKQLTYQSDMNVQYFFWASDSNIVYSNSHSPSDSLRIFGISVNSEQSLPLIPVKKAKLRWLQPQKLYGSYLLASLNDRDSTAFDLYKVFLDGRAPQLVTRNPGNILNWFPSPDGKVRLAVTSDSVQESILYRQREELAFKPVSTTDYQTLIQPLGFVKNKKNIIYALSNDGRDKLSLVEYNVESGEEERLLYGNAEVDLESQGYSDNLQEMIFTQYTAEKSEKLFFNKSFQRHFESLAAQFENRSIDILDTDSSLNHWIVKISTDVHAGGIYYYDVQSKKTQLLAELNPKLAKAELSPKQPIRYQSRDGLTINGYLTYPRTQARKDLPVVVLVHDGPNRRESVDFDAEVQFLANRGYLVFQLNYRGSVGYGKQFWTAGFKEWGGKIQSDIIDGVTTLIHQGIVDKRRVAIMGTGFGGYSALHAATYNSSFYRCAISMSGYTNLFTYIREIPPHQQQYLRLVYNIIGNPSKEYEMFKAISPVFHADRVKIPVMFAQGGSDRFSSLTDANQFVQKLKNNNVPVKYIYKEEEGRRFRSEENIINYYQEVEAFLSKYL